MNKSCFIITILHFTLISYLSIFAMEIQKPLTINDIVTYQDIKTIILSTLPKEDQNDFRLVCKEWASKGPNWTFMPTSVETRYDHIRLQNKHCNALHKTKILWDLTTKNDFEGINWMIQSPYIHRTLLFANKWLTEKCRLSASMIAIHNKNCKMVRLLCESCNNSQEQCWKTYYNTATIPREIEQCLYPSNSRDFSFLFYLAAIWLDNKHDLKKLYSEKTPTTLGLTLLINYSLSDNSQKCFKYLLTKKRTKEIIKKDEWYYFRLAISTHQKKLPKLLIKKKLFLINKIFEYTENPQKKCTILDYYEQDEDLKKDYTDIALLISLGAKRYNELPSEQHPGSRKVGSHYR